MQIESALKAAADWCNAWNRRDLDAIMEHYANDVARRMGGAKRYPSVARYGRAPSDFHAQPNFLNPINAIPPVQMER